MRKRDKIDAIPAVVVMPIDTREIAFGVVHDAGNGHAVHCEVPDVSVSLPNGAWGGARVSVNHGSPLTLRLEERSGCHGA